MRWGPILRGLVYGLTLVGVFTLALSSLTYFDFWWYLKSGELILATRSVPAADPFSFTAKGRPWVNHMWASQVLIVALWETGGRVVLVLLKAIVVTASFGVVLLTMHRRGVHLIVASAITLLAAWAGWEFWDVRPQIVTYLLLAIFLHVLRDGWEERRRELFWLPVLMIPWANLHAGFVTGIGVIGLVGAATALPRLLDPARRQDGWRALALALGVAVLATLASLVNPYGIRAVLFPLEVVQTRLFMASTSEWFSPNFHNPAYQGFEVMLLLLVPAFAWGRSRLRAPDVVLVLALAHLALASARHIPLFAVAVAPALADSLQAAPRELWGRRPGGFPGIAYLRARLPSLWPVAIAPATHLAVFAFLIVVPLVAAWGSFLDPASNPFALDLNERRYPERTMTFIKEQRLPAPLFNAYAWGGYELWRLYPEYQVFIDGRTHVYGREVLRDFLEVSTLTPRWQSILDKWNIQTVLAERRSSLTQALLAVKGWRLVFAERDAAVFVREAEAHRELLARLPPAALSEPLPEVVMALAVALRAAEAGDNERAIRHYQEILALDPDHPVALMSLALLREKKGETVDARRLFERVLELDPDGNLAEAARGRLDRLR